MKVHLNSTFFMIPSFYLILLFTWVSSLFFIGNPYLSLILMISSFFCYFWTFFQLFQIDLSLKNFGVMNIFIITILSFYMYVSKSSSFMIYFLFALKIIVFLFAISIFVTMYNPKKVYLTKYLFLSLLLFFFFLGIFLCLVKFYFLDALNFGTTNNVANSVYFSFNNYNFWDVSNNALFSLDFTNDNQLSEFAVQLSKFKETRWLFHYLAQMLFLDSSWLHIHLSLVFV